MEYSCHLEVVFQYLAANKFKKPINLNFKKEEFCFYLIQEFCIRPLTGSLHMSVYLFCFYNSISFHYFLVCIFISILSLLMIHRKPKTACFFANSWLFFSHHQKRFPKVFETGKTVYLGLFFLLPPFY